ncbi:MAG: hypothetical protein PVH87_13270 [Desulfobacteraceae bacterium]|jgi:hypothetical protein
MTIQPTIPITSEQYVSLLEGLEKQAPGITRIKRNDDGVIMIGDDDA